MSAFILAIDVRSMASPRCTSKPLTPSSGACIETIALAPLVLFVFVIGFFPSIFLDRTRDAVQSFYERYNAVWAEGRSEESSSRLLRPSVDRALERGAPPVPGESPTASAQGH